MNNNDNSQWHKFGVPFIAGLLLLVASIKAWSTPSGEVFSAILLGSSLTLLGFAARDWTGKDKEK